MKKLFDKPYLIFFLAIPVIIMAGVLRRDEVLDISVYDTYYVISYFFLTTIISIFFGLIAIGYWIMPHRDRNFSKLLTKIHIGLTVGGTLILLILSNFYRKEFVEYEWNNNLTATIWTGVFLIAIGQSLFVINMIYATRKSKFYTTGS